MDDGESTIGKKTGDTDGGDQDRSPRKEVTGGVEGGKEGDAEAAVGHGVEKAVAGGGQEEVGPQGELAEAWNGLPKCEEHGSTCQKCSEEKGMCEAAVSPEVAVVGAEPEADDVKVGNDGAEGSRDPDALRNSGPIETRTDPEGRDRVGENGRHSGEDEHDTWLEDAIGVK